VSRSTEINVRVGLANRNYSLDSNLITSRAVNCPPSSSKLFQLMREILEFKHRQSMFEKARLTANSTTVNKKVFLADSSKQATTSAVNMAYVKPRLIDDVVEEEVDTDDTTVTDDLSNGKNCNQIFYYYSRQIYLFLEFLFHILHLTNLCKIFDYLYRNVMFIKERRPRIVSHKVYRFVFFLKIKYTATYDRDNVYLPRSILVYKKTSFFLKNTSFTSKP